MVALAIFPALAIGVFTITWTRDSLWKSAIQQIEFDTASNAQVVKESLRAVQQELRYLAQTKVTRDLAEATVAGTSARVATLRAELEREFYVFAQGKRAFYQVRYLNGAGRELVRLNVQDGEPRIVPADRLQDKSDRYYVKKTLLLEPGKTYISPMDLNEEYGKVESPQRGVVRYATPVVGSNGKSAGLLVINIFADYLFSLIGPLPSETEGYLVDREGMYLGYVGPSEQSRHLYSLENRRQISADYAPPIVSAIVENKKHGQAIATARALLAFAPIGMETETVDQGVPAQQWMLLVAHQLAPIDAPIRHLTVFLSVVTALVAAIAGVLGVLVAHYLTRPVSILRRATREVVADLSKHVEVTTGDEIEGLANDFNVMTERLLEAREKLAAWNAELECEVALKTDELHRLQDGLGRAEKLASIGQMTASVMHEIGNPLAAIETKIQVAEEDEDFNGQCDGLLSNIISEVDRLTMFLRSFAHLARLREPQMEEVSPDQVVQGVITLISPELRRRGVTLRVESTFGAPTFRGDPNQMRQLLINLLLNAAEASPQGGEILVNVQGVPASFGGGSVIKVSDQGTGMSPETIDKIWDPFFTTKSEGTGLGLPICQQIVKDHDGTIRVHSQQGRGTLVILSFPTDTAKESTMASGKQDDFVDNVEGLT